MRSGGGEILQGPRRRASFGSADTAPPRPPTLTPVALGLGVGEGRPCGSAPTTREREEGAARGGNFVSTRVSRDQKPETGAAVPGAGTGGVSSPETAGSRALFSLEVKGQNCWQAPGLETRPLGGMGVGMGGGGW